MLQVDKSHTNYIFLTELDLVEIPTAMCCQSVSFKETQSLTSRPTQYNVDLHGVDWLEEETRFISLKKHFKFL